MLSRRALAPALSLVLTAGGVTLAAAPAMAQPRLAAAVVDSRQAAVLDLVADVLPFITGSGAIGESLSLALPQWSLPGVTNEIQWLANGVPVPGATSGTFVPTLAQAGMPVRAVVTGVLTLPLLGELRVPVLSNVLTIPLPGDGGGGGGGEDPVLSILQAPSLTGIPGVGSLLQVINPVWNQLGVQNTYQWFVDDVPVPGATGQTFTPRLEDAGKQVRAVVTGTLAGLPVVTALTDLIPIPAVAEQPLSPASQPTVTAVGGTAKVGRTLSVQDPTWNEEGVTHTYQWMRAGSPIAGATGETYTVLPDDVGRSILVKVTGTKQGWTAGTVDSNAVTPTVGDPISVTVPPAVSGTAALGRTLTATSGTWGAGTLPAFTYQWRRGTTAIAGATAPTYAVTASDLGSTLSVVVTATRAGYQPGSFTTANLPVAKLASATTIKGKKRVRAGKPLRVVLGVLVDGFAPDGTVTVLDGARELKTVPIASGARKLKVKGLKPGRHTLSAVYSGSGATEESRSKVLKVRVLKRR